VRDDGPCRVIEPHELARGGDGDAVGQPGSQPGVKKLPSSRVIPPPCTKTAARRAPFGKTRVLDS
jgi:hypothetical protein